MKIKKGLNISTTDFWYDLTAGGYLKPNEICDDPKDVVKVAGAIATILEFQKSCESQIKDFIQ
jgi:hypothetical protein